MPFSGTLAGGSVRRTSGAEGPWQEGTPLFSQRGADLPMFLADQPPPEPLFPGGKRGMPGTWDGGEATRNPFPSGGSLPGLP